MLAGVYAAVSARDSVLMWCRATKKVFSFNVTFGHRSHIALFAIASSFWKPSIQKFFFVNFHFFSKERFIPFRNCENILVKMTASCSFTYLAYLKYYLQWNKIAEGWKRNLEKSSYELCYLSALIKTDEMAINIWSILNHGLERKTKENHEVYEALNSSCKYTDY